MSFSYTNETVTISLPEIPFLSTYPFTASIPTSSLRTLLRLVVIIATYLLFRPQLERLFRRALGRDDPAAQVANVNELQSRMRTLEQEKGVVIGGGRKVAVATGAGEAAVGGSAQTPKARRKA